MIAPSPMPPAAPLELLSAILNLLFRFVVKFPLRGQKASLVLKLLSLIKIYSLACFSLAAFRAAPRGADGILVTSNQALLKQIPAKFRLKANSEDLPKICTLAQRDGDLWRFESGGYQFALPKDSVTVQPNFNKTLNLLMRFFPP